MINPFDYLYYKIYTAWSYINGGGYPIRQHGAMWLLLFLNILTIYLLITDFIINTFMWCAGVFILIILFICYRPKREVKILAKYSKESEMSRIIGDATVVLYVIISIFVFTLVLKTHINR
jgi:hypothetical protein